MKALCIVFMKEQEIQGITEKMKEERHNESLKKVEDAMKKEVKKIIITNSSAGLKWGYKDYLKLADKYEYEIFIADNELKMVLPFNDWAKMEDFLC